MHPFKFSDKLSKKWVYLIFALGLFVSFLSGLCGGMKTGMPARLNNFFLDSYLKYSASNELAESAVSVDIDEMSLSALGQWPWPRYRIAALVQAIAEANPAAIGLDIMFPEPDRTSLDEIQGAFKRDFGVDMSFAGVPEGLMDNDGYFGGVLASTGAVGARHFLFDHESDFEVLKEPEFGFTGRIDLLQLNDATGVLDNTYKISSQLRYAGFLNTRPDDDGMLRRVPLLMRRNGAIYPHLSLATFMRSLGVDSAVIERGAGGPVIRVKDHFMSIDEGGFALLRFSGKPHLYPSLSAVDVFNGAFDKKDIEGKIVFIGSSAAALHDLHGTIFDSQFPGLKTQAAAVENMIGNGFVREPSLAGVAVLLASIVAGLLVSALFISSREPLLLLLGTAAVAIAALVISACVFMYAKTFISPFAPISTTVVLFAFFTTTRFAIEKRHAYAWFRKLANARAVAMESMAAVAETRDPETGAHIMRTKHYVKAIAEKIMKTGAYPELVTPEYIDLLFASTPLHDIGKVGVPDAILLKHGRLTPDEFTVMKKHAEYGKDIIRHASKHIEGNNFLTLAGELAASHHEKWDGTGYPLGLSGETIPLSGRIMSVADVYDALISKRYYKPALTHDEAVDIMRKDRGGIFDPRIFDIFLEIQDEIREIASRYTGDDERVLGDR